MEIDNSSGRSRTAKLKRKTTKWSGNLESMSVPFLPSESHIAKKFAGNVTTWGKSGPECQANKPVGRLDHAFLAPRIRLIIFNAKRIFSSSCVD